MAKIRELRNSCPPGCLCDAPWSFLPESEIPGYKFLIKQESADEAAVGKQETEELTGLVGKVMNSDIAVQGEGGAAGTSTDT